MSSQYTFDKENYKFKKEKMSVWAVLRRILMFFVASLSLAVVYYIVFSLVFSTDTEKRLKRENKMYEEEVPVMEERERLLSDVLDGLRLKDDEIYEEVFQAAAPVVDPIHSVDILSGLDSVPDTKLVVATESKISELESRAGTVEENFQVIADLLADREISSLPMTMPLKDISYAQTAASVGNKVNPFYKVPIMHNGLDLIAPSGEAVYAAASGRVSKVSRSRKGLGNVVEITHGDGYKTVYAHLSDIYVVRGRLVKKGQRIGLVGVSGNSFAPHLHYEVRKDTLILEPINHFFATVDAEEYVNMLIMSSMTGQSMD